MTVELNTPRDVLADLDSIKAYVEANHGKSAPVGPVVTAHSRFEEHFNLFRGSLESILALKQEDEDWARRTQEEGKYDHEDELERLRRQNAELRAGGAVSG